MNTTELGRFMVANALWTFENVSGVKVNTTTFTEEYLLYTYFKPIQKSLKGKYTVSDGDATQFHDSSDLVASHVISLVLHV